KADAPLRVASYNVRCHNCTLYNEEQPWRVRRDYVAATINDADPDVVSLQEAQQSRLLDDSSTTQFEDLRTVLNSGLDGAPWALTNGNRYNCVKSTSATNCVYADQGASNGTRIVYRADRLVLNSQGSQRLPQLTDSSYERYVVWAFFKQKSTGKKFLFAAIHLEPGNDPSGSDAYAQNRRVQAQAALDKLTELNTAGLPIVLAGDASASRADRDGLTGERSNPPYEVFTAGGLVDPLGNVSTAAPVNAPVEVRIHTDYNSVNKFERTARKYSGVNGAYNDYIFTTPMRVSEWETVVKLDETGCFVGVIPSDHNLIRATVWLP
ncbi:MAG: endonuclease/exonuclease/phosphatase family protein, partial [Propionicimonas sp.]